MKNVLISLVVSIAVTIAGLWYYDSHYATKIAVIDFKAYTEQLKQDYALKKISFDELKRRLNALVKAVREESRKNPNTVILFREAVANGRVKDVTPKIKNPAPKK